MIVKIKDGKKEIDFDFKDNFTGVWMPKEILFFQPKNKNFRFTKAHKELLSIINSFENCTASNQYFAAILSLNVRRIANLMTELKREKLILCDVERYDSSFKVKRREISINTATIQIRRDFHGKVTPSQESENSNHLKKKVVAQKSEVLYNSIDNKEKDNIKSKPKRFSSEVAELVSHFEKVTGKKIRDGVENTNCKFILQRLAQGYQVDLLKAVIDLKSKEWLKDLKMKKFVRFATLFNKSNFENYIDEISESIRQNETPSSNGFYKEYNEFLATFGEKAQLEGRLSEKVFNDVLSGKHNPKFMSFIKIGMTEIYKFGFIKRATRWALTNEHAKTLNKSFFLKLINQIDENLKT